MNKPKLTSTRILIAAFFLCSLTSLRASAVPFDLDTTFGTVGGAQGFFVAWFGLADDATTADYEGNVKTDIAVFRPSNGIWYLRQSQSGFNTVAFGAGNDKPVPNAFIP